MKIWAGVLTSAFFVAMVFGDQRTSRLITNLLPAQPAPPMTNTKTTLDYVIIGLLYTVEAALWLINELMGNHRHQQPRPLALPPAAAVDVEAVEVEEEVIDVTFDTSSHAFPEQDLTSLTVKQLKALARKQGVKYTKKTRKADLVALLQL